MPPRKNTEELFRDPRRARIHRRLLLIGEGPAAFYRDACLILDIQAGLLPRIQAPSELTRDVQGPRLRLVAAAHLVGHLFREIESAIRDVLVPVDARIDPDRKHRSEIDAILSAYELDQDATVAAAWHRLTGKGEYDLHKQAHRDNLGRPRALNESYFSDVEAVFDAVLGRFEERFTETLDVVDALVAKHPATKGDLKVLRKKVPNNLITLHYFFSHATDSAWLDLLDGDGAFATPPEPVPDEEEDASVIQPWPASQYLARMATVPELQERVAEIALAVPPTHNVRVHEDLADVALALPVPLALQFVDQAKTWCRDPSFPRVADKIGDLIERFLGAGEVDVALELAGALLDPENRATTDVHSGHEAWKYGQSLHKLAPSLVAAGGLRALGILTSCLVKLLRKATATREQSSYIWRPAIEPHEQNRSHRSDARQTLIDAVRDGAEAICAADPSQVAAVVQQLQSGESPVLDRIALHLLRVASEVPVDLIASHLLDRDRLDNSNSWHEYTLLAGSRLADLRREEQVQIIRWAVEREVKRATAVGPDEEGSVEAPETTHRRARAFELRALERFRAVLPDEFRGRHEELEQEFGSDEHPEFLSYHQVGVGFGTTSPATADELRALSVEELVAYLKAWIPERGPMSPSREGLARELGNLVAAEPERFASAAGSFHDLHPPYVRGLIGGLNSAARNGGRIDWKPMLDLCAWVVEQGTPARSDDEFADAPEAWAGTRSEVARLLEHGFHDGAQELPFEFRHRAWAIVERLASDPDPTPDHEAQFFGSTSSAYHLAINTIRGTAVEAAVQYGLWVKRHLGELSTNFHSMPELRSLLEVHLKPSIDPSLAVRSTYGRWLPWIHLLDPNWTATHLGHIFPAEGAHEDLRQAAWTAYILYCRPYDEMLPVLRDEYRHAVSDLGRASDQSRRSPDESLAENLMIFYLRGRLDLGDELLAGFFEWATETTRQHAMRFVGRVLHDNDDLDATLIARATALWENRTADLHVAAAERRLELAAFGWWFASSLDAGWRLTQLERVLSRNLVVEEEHLVLGQLLVLVPQYPIDVLVCVRWMIEDASDRWMVFSWRQELREILKAALRSENPDAARAARAIVGLLVARGETAYRALLGSSS